MINAVQSIWGSFSGLHKECRNVDNFKLIPLIHMVQRLCQLYWSQGKSNLPVFLTSWNIFSPVSKQQDRHINTVAEVVHTRFPNLCVIRVGKICIWIQWRTIQTLTMYFHTMKVAIILMPYGSNIHGFHHSEFLQRGQSVQLEQYWTVSSSLS